MASAPSDTNLALWRQLGATTTHENADIVMSCDIIFLAVKPHLFPVVMAGLEIDGIEEDPKTLLKAAEAETAAAGGIAVVDKAKMDDGGGGKVQKSVTSPNTR